MRAGPQTGDKKQTGTRHVANLASTDPVFDGVYTSPGVLAAVHQILKRPFRVYQLAGRDPLPGYGQQGLHIDWLQRSGSEPFSLVTTIWLLDDYTTKNGATRLVPGSHLVPGPLPKSMQDPANRHPKQKVITASAGSVLVFNGHLYHSGTRNESNQPRRVLQCQFLA
jgi:ectoine hydroxylase-related dioxygenase (phytanoyl-CoA dioxygenase family)